jgi:hypothetical protein
MKLIAIKMMKIETERPVRILRMCCFIASRWTRSHLLISTTSYRGRIEIVYRSYGRQSAVGALDGLASVATIGDEDRFLSDFVEICSAHGLARNRRYNARTNNCPLRPFRLPVVFLAKS